MGEEEKGKDEGTPQCIDLEARHKHRTRIAILILIIVLVPTVLYTVYPRVDIEIKVWYSEGMLGAVSVDVELRNTGTVSVSVTEFSMSVLNSSQRTMGFSDYGRFELEPRNKYEGENIKMNAVDLGNDTTWSDFEIRIVLEFSTSNSNFEVNKTYKTTEPAMSIVFKDRVSKWGG